MFSFSYCCIQFLLLCVNDLTIIKQLRDILPIFLYINYNVVISMLIQSFAN